jgi:hypothetical protein
VLSQHDGKIVPSIYYPGEDPINIAELAEAHLAANAWAG